MFRLRYEKRDNVGLTAATGRPAPGRVPAGTMTLMFRPARDVSQQYDNHSVNAQTIFALRHGKGFRHRPDERGNLRREVGRDSGRDDRLLDALVPECCGIDDPSVPRDGLGELQTKLSDP